ncbi:MAG: PilZ domain-containing protein [bacterium]
MEDTRTPASEARERREFIRHPASIPIAVTVASERPARLQPIRDLGYGGLAFSTPSPIRPGTTVSIRIRALDPAATIVGQVAWCKATADGFDVGIQFLGGDTAYRARMIEQVCHIQEYQERIRVREGRKLTRSEAACEWIAKHAASFPEPAAAI